MDDFFSSDEDYYASDRESLDGIENDDSGFNSVATKGPSTRVLCYFSDYST